MLLSAPPTLIFSLPWLFSVRDPQWLLASFVTITHSAWSGLQYHAYTALLFTLADMKTIFFPISSFACATAPLQSIRHLVKGLIWIWLHQLMCNVSNQARSCAEDAVNKPWRPLPSNRVTESQARWLRWAVVALCFGYSMLHGPDLAVVTLGLLATTFLYDEAGLSAHYVGKNFCNIGGYTCLELGATKLMGATTAMDRVSATAVCVSGLLIFTTIQAQDFADVEGDSALGRRTFPIYAPRLARAVTLVAIPAWSFFLARFWAIGSLWSSAFVAWGSLVAMRYFFLRTADEDRRSYLFYNIWLTVAHVMPVHARTGAFSL
ncbi:UbiA prenyltransferase family-domain-containing protein [Trametes meyenii]|nr:UbiA prenyltransferase family-domain-containing protein [Trametes meyenii]